MEKIVKLNSAIQDARNKTTLDEKWIIDLAAKASDQIISELEKIDAETEEKLASLDAERKLLIKSEIDELKKEKKEIILLLEKTNKHKEKEKLLNRYLDVTLKIQSLYAAAKEENANNKSLVIKKERNKKIVYITLKSAPFVFGIVTAFIVALHNKK